MGVFGEFFGAFNEVGGILEYERRATRRGVYLLIALMACILAAIIVLPSLGLGSVQSYSGVSDSGIFPVFMVVVMMRAARRDTTFLIARPMARGSVWLGLIAHMVMLSIILAALRVAFELIGYSIVLPLTRSKPNVYGFAPESEWAALAPFTPNQSLPTFWRGIKDIVSAGILAYCYGCLLSRWKSWTIGISIGLPVLGFVVFVLPVFIAFTGDFKRVVDSGGQSSMATASAMLLVMKWVDIIQGIMDWIEKYFDWLFWGAAALAVPASWLTMRTARHTG